MPGPLHRAPAMMRHTPVGAPHLDWIMFDTAALSCSEGVWQLRPTRLNLIFILSQFGESESLYMCNSTELDNWHVRCSGCKRDHSGCGG